MANSKFEYVRGFESDPPLLPNTYIVIRIDGRGFHKLSKHYNFAKPNDSHALKLMNAAATKTIAMIQDICFAYGVSDEYSFVFDRSTNLFERRRDKLVSTVVSTFTAAYVGLWPEHFGSVEGSLLDLGCLPTFDARAVLYPSKENLRDYLSWRQVDCHINNLYNTTFWNLVQGRLSRQPGGIEDQDLRINGKRLAPNDTQARDTTSLKPPEDSTLANIDAKISKDEASVQPMSPTEAETFLSGTLSSDKNEILFSRFSINYNDEPAMFRKGSCIYREMHINDRPPSKSNSEPNGGALENETSVTEVGDRQKPTSNDRISIIEKAKSKTEIEKQKKAKLKAEIVVRHVDIIKDNFWDERPWILGGKSEM